MNGDSLETIKLKLEAIKLEANILFLDKKIQKLDKDLYDICSFRINLISWAYYNYVSNLPTKIKEEKKGYEYRRSEIEEEAKLAIKRMH